MSNLIIYGGIGYTILRNNITNNVVLLFSDMHDQLNSCYRHVNIADWLSTKLNTSIILIEEVPRENINIRELWTQSEHTQALKNFYLSNSNKIIGFDIRPFYVPYSWEIGEGNDTLDVYKRDIDNFFNFRNHYLSGKVMINTHFRLMKRTYDNYIRKYAHLMNTKIAIIAKTNVNALEELNLILGMIMEWYAITEIVSNNNTSIILHAGLFHTENIVDVLIKIYGYTIEQLHGINKIAETMDNPNGCLVLNKQLAAQFGGL